MVERPLSPFTTVYRWAYTNTLSILHRVTGLVLVGALLGLVVWLIGISFGRDSYVAFQTAYTSIPARVVMSAAVIALIYHWCNGLRHLAWDIGWGFEKVSARRSAGLVVAVTAIGAVVCIYFILCRGAGLP